MGVQVDQDTDPSLVEVAAAKVERRKHWLINFYAQLNCGRTRNELLTRYTLHRCRRYGAGVRSEIMFS